MQCNISTALAFAHVVRNVMHVVYLAIPTKFYVKICCRPAAVEKRWSMSRRVTWAIMDIESIKVNDETIFCLFWGFYCIF